MKPSKVMRAAAFMAFVFACTAGLAACSSGGGSGDVAATVNGTKIMEDEVTEYVAEFRENNGLGDDEQWDAWMVQSGMTPETVRSQVIDMFADKELVKQAAKEKGIKIDAKDIDAQIEKTKANYDSDEAWQKALESVGTNEEEYRENIEEAMLQQKLQEAVNEEESADGEVSDEEFVQYLNTYAPAFDGAKRSSHILFSADDKETAQDVLNKINSGELDFAEAAKQYSIDSGSAENGGDVGWDQLNTFVTEYQVALSELDEGQVSDLVESEYGYHIIKCTEVFTAPEEITSADQVPAEFADYVRSMLNDNLSAGAFTTWLADYKEKADVKINDMPEGLPYDVLNKDAEGEEAAESEDGEGDQAAEASEEGSDAESADEGASDDESSENADDSEKEAE